MASTPERPDVPRNASLLGDLLRSGAPRVLSVRDDTRTLEIHIGRGQIAKATASDDTVAVLARLVNGGSITPGIADRLEAEVRQGACLSELLRGFLPEPLVAERLAERFDENLASFLLARGEIHMAEGPWTPEEHRPSAEGLARLDAMSSALHRLSSVLGLLDRLRFTVGNRAPDSLEAARLVDLVETSYDAESLLANSPHERVATLLSLMDLVDREVLVIELMSVFHVENAPPPTEPPADEEPLVTEEPPAEEEPLIAEELPTRNRVIVDLDGPAGPNTEERAAIEDVLFRDFDSLPRQAGQFIVAREHLDIVELGRAEPKDDPSEQAVFAEMIETDEASEEVLSRAVSLCFGPPTLDDDLVRRKAEVLNDLLREIVRTLDQEKGPGTGRAAVQILLDGTPPHFAPLLVGLEAQRDGAVNPDSLLRSLRRRPDTEQRTLLHQALGNLVERGLGTVMDNIGAEATDRMLERIAGVQQRMGI